LPRDLEIFSDYWLISDRMKAVLEEVDPGGVAFVRCDLFLADGTPGSELWLCDVLRVIDALDEAASDARILFQERSGRKVYGLAGADKLIFKEEVIGVAHVFRMAHLEPHIICDDAARDACRAANLRGVRFDPVIKS